MPQKPLPDPVKAIKTPFKFLIVGFFVISGFLFVNEAVLGAVSLETGFEEFNIGSLTGQYPFDSLSSQMYVTTDISHFGIKSAWAYADLPRFRTEILDTLFNGIWNGYVYWTAAGSTANQDLCLQRNKADLWCISMSKDAADVVTVGEDFEIPLLTWTYWEIQWENGNIKYTFDGGLNWIETYDSDVVAGVNGYFSFGNAARNVYFDDFGGSNCQFNQTYLTCENAGCCWYYSYLLWEYFCVECPTGECSSGIYDCQNCLTEETCEAEEFCYWFEGFCRYGTGECGEGLELQFCENQADCENAGGYWYGDYCWLEAKPSLLDFGDYYDEHGDYATPSAWIVSVASSTTGFFESIGGFLTTFEKFFDLKEAHQRGIDFGSAIPTARGFLTIFDDFLGNLPISGFFIFILGFMLAVGVFRIVRNLVQLLKFW